MLQPRDFRVLAALTQHIGQVLSRDALLELAYPDPAAVTDRVIDVQISRLRKAFGTHASMIETVLGAGYKLARPASPAPQ